MGHVNIDLFAFPDDIPEEVIEEKLTTEYSPEYIDFGEPIAVGRVAHDPYRKFTHGAISRFTDEEFWDGASVKWAEAIKQAPDDDPVGPFMVYHPKQWLGLRIVDFDDPYAKEHGIVGWAKRLSRPFLELARNDPRYAQVLGTLFANFLINGDVPPRTAEAWVRESLGIPFQDHEWS